MAGLKGIFGLFRDSQEEMIAEEVHKSEGDFEVPIVNQDTGEVRRVLNFASAKDFAMEIRGPVFKNNEEYFDLSGKDLSGVDFSDSPELYGANFDGSNLAGAKFMRTDITGGSFKNCNMQGVDMEDAIIRYADFSDTDLSGAFMEQAKVNRTKFTRAKLAGAFLANVVAPDADFEQADLTRAVTTSMDIKGANLHFAKITRRQLSDCKNTDKAQYMTASYLLKRAGRKRKPGPS